MEGETMGPVVGMKVIGVELRIASQTGQHFGRTTEMLMVPLDLEVPAELAENINGYWTNTRVEMQVTVHTSAGDQDATIRLPFQVRTPDGDDPRNDRTSEAREREEAAVQRLHESALTQHHRR